MSKKPILVLDFDGVIHDYSSGWKGAAVIPDAPVPGSIAFILTALDRFTVAIHSSRSHQWGGKRSMKRWLKKHLIAWFNDTYKFVEEEQICSDPLAWRDFYSLSGFNPSMDPWDVEVNNWADSIIRKIRWPLFKPPAIMTIDDRSITFSGVWPTMEEIAAFRPWNKKGKSE